MFLRRGSCWSQRKQSHSMAPYCITSSVTASEESTFSIKVEEDEVAYIVHCEAQG